MAPMKRPATPGHGEYRGTWSLSEVARRLKIPKKRLRYMLGNGDMGFVQICGRIRVPIDAAKRYLNREV